MKHHFELNWTEFCFFSANVIHVFGKKDLSDLYSLYKRTMLALKVPVADAGLIRETSIGEVKLLLNKQPSLIISFHYGMYWKLPNQLINQGCKVAILVSRDIIQNQQRFSTKNLAPSLRQNLVFIDAEDPSIFFRIRILNQDGFHVLCYMDGGVGAKQLSSINKEKLSNVNFGQGVVCVRKGVFEIAYLLRLPIHYFPDLSTSSALAGIVSFYPIDGEHRGAYVKRILHETYLLLYGCINKDLTRWEGWFFMHHSLLPIPNSFNKGHLYLPFAINKRYYLMNVYNYESREVGVENFGFVKDSIGCQLDIC
ncbi:hypothetical protein ACFSQ3_08800 [Sphingobacterium corticis]|uniref:Lipid A biosynthesis lauroyl acyltransferase n=1 Tax=Sphingobacterium corticis TaxID=1812823 RepID=A0ABW5NJC7_9SPHI